MVDIAASRALAVQGMRQGSPRGGAWPRKPLSDARAYDADMPDEFDNDQDMSQARREAVVEVANLTNGMMGGVFDRAHSSSRVLGLSRPHSTVIWRVRVASAVAAISLAILAIASPIILAVTVGPAPDVGIALGVTAVAAGIVFVSSYVAERREIARRVAGEEG